MNRLTDDITSNPPGTIEWELPSIDLLSACGYLTSASYRDFDMAASKMPFPAIERVTVDPVQVATFKNEDNFMELAFGLLREVASYIAVAASTLGPKPVWTRDQAAVGGNMVRLFKLLSAFLDQTQQRRPETSSILSRLAFETIVSVRYLIANFSPELAVEFRKHSLRHERRLWDAIQANIKARGGAVLPIEDRMMKSIERAASLSGFAIETIDLKAKGPWGGKDLRQKAEAVGLNGLHYLAAFGGMSHNVHGAWFDLQQYHLEERGTEEFVPQLKWGRPRPQPLFALGILSLDAANDFFGFIGGEEVVAYKRDKLNDLTDRIHRASEAHEVYLVGKTWPEI